MFAIRKKKNAMKPYSGINMDEFLEIFISCSEKEQTDIRERLQNKKLGDLENIEKEKEKWQKRKKK